jgi:hypothetical protein
MTEPDPARHAARRPRPPAMTSRDVLASQGEWLELEQPAYLVAALGRPGNPGWRELALEIERYRRASGISCRVSALGTPPPGTSEDSTGQGLAQAIAKYQGVARVRLHDLCVFPSPVDRQQEPATLSLLEACRWLGVLAPKEIEAITSMPTLVLRRHVTFATSLLSRPPRSLKLAPLRVEVTDVRAHQAAHEAALRQTQERLQTQPGQPARRHGATEVRLAARLEVHQAALSRVPLVRRRVDRLQRKLCRSGEQAPSPKGLHQLPVVIGLHSAYELARRDLEALIALERDPPEYLARALGSIPSSAEVRARWREGTRLIEWYRAQHGIEDRREALGPRPRGHDANLCRKELAEQLRALRVNLHRAVVVDGRDIPGEPSGVELGPT